MTKSKQIMRVAVQRLVDAVLRDVASPHAEIVLEDLLESRRQV